MASFRDRIIGAAALRSATYEDVEHDGRAMPQALAVVVLSSLAAAFGMGLRASPADIVRGTLTALAGWFIWSAITFFVGTKILATRSTHATWGQLLRTTGFATAPGILRIIGIIPFTSSLIFFVTSVWMLIAFVIAVQEALDYRNVWRAVAVCFIGWIIYVVFGLFVM